MLTLTGDFGNLQFLSLGTSRYLQIPSNTATFLFKKLALQYPELVANQLGIYTIGSVGRNKEVKWASMNAPRHVLSSRKDGCTWNPKGKITNDITSTTLCPVEYNGEQCPDALWESCFEAVFGVGNEIRDITATPEGSQVLTEILRNVYLGLGNSFYELASYGSHPLIEEADEKNWFTVTQEQWDDYLDQQEACVGYMTLIDKLKADGLPNFNIPIAQADVDGKVYKGDAIALIDRVTTSNSALFAQVLQQGVVTGVSPIVQLSTGIFNRFREQLVTKFSHIPDVYLYWTEGINGNRTFLPGVIRYNGYTIYNNTSWGIFDELTGTITHRALLTAPGAIGVVADIPDLKQFTGMGMRVTQHLDAPWQGKIFMDTTFKVGAALLTSSLMNNASLTLVPQ